MNAANGLPQDDEHGLPGNAAHGLPQNAARGLPHGAAQGLPQGASKATAPTITLAHGGGGRAMRSLIESIILPAFDNPLLAALEDQARLDLTSLIALGDRLAFTTDTYVVTPLEFPGGDIGRLAVCGTVNDLAVCGALPLYLSCGFVLEEGLSIEDLTRIARSMAAAARDAGVSIVTGCSSTRRGLASFRGARKSAPIARVPVTRCS
jgi:hypothetical protein